MARGINKVILIGNLGQDPETRFSPGGSSVTKLNLATAEGWKDKQTGQFQEHTEWHRIACFGRLSEIAAEYLRKGSKVYIEGRLRTSKWQDKNGQDRYTTEVIANEMQMLDSRGGNAGGGNFNNASSNNATGGAQAAEQAAPAGATEDFDDDIPF